MFLKILRCFTVQAIGKALLWIVLISGAGYAAYKSVGCPQGQTCFQPQEKSK